MYKCKYCGRYLKNNYNDCPGCGSNTFEITHNKGTIKITNVPDGGYKIKYIDLKVKYFEGILILLLGITIVISGFYSLTFQTTLSMLMANALFLLFGLSVVFWGINSKNTYRDKIDKIKRLKFNGILIKNLTYEINQLGFTQDNNLRYFIETIYINENGRKVKYISNNKYGNPKGAGTVDLLIDPKDHDNYFIDFEIY